MIAYGDVVLVALPGDYGKPRPALVVQADRLNRLPSVVLCPLTTTIRNDLPDIRFTIAPSPENGLHEVSQVMTEKPVAVPRDRVRARIGKLSAEAMSEVTGLLAILFGIV